MRTFIPPEDVANEARLGLKLRSSQPNSNKCCTPVGIRRATQLANRQPVSEDTLRRMKSYFSRHSVDSLGKGWGVDSKGYQAWLCWGGDSGREWASRCLMENSSEMPTLSEQDEKKWEAAKSIAEKKGLGDNYAYIMGIYKKMKPLYFRTKETIDLNIDGCEILLANYKKKRTVENLLRLRDSAAITQAMIDLFGFGYSDREGKRTTHKKICEFVSIESGKLRL